MFDGITQEWDKCLSPERVPTLKCAFVAFNNVINAAILLSGAVAVFFMIWAGYKFIMSQGDPEAITAARQTFFYALFGLIFVVLAYAIFNFFLNDLFGLNGQFIEIN